MKPAIIVTVALALCVYFSPRCEGQQRPKSGANGTTTENQERRPPTVQIPYEIQNQWVQTETRDREKESPAWYKSPDWVLVIVGCITFIVIGWQSFETRRTANAAIAANAAAKTANAETLAEIRRQADLAEDTMIVAHRAYVGIDSIVLRLPEHRNMEFSSWVPASHVEIVLRNTGITRAKEFEFRYGFYIDNLAPRPIAAVMRDRQSRAFNPNSTLTIRSPLMNDMFTTMHTVGFDHLVTHRNLMMTGTYKYRDIFGANPLWSFTARIDPAPDGAGDDAVIPFEVLGEAVDDLNAVRAASEQQQAPEDTHDGGTPDAGLRPN